MTGALPPSSRCVRLTDLAAACSTFLPVATSPVIEIMLILGWLISALPTLLAAAEDDVDHALGQNVGEDLGELQRGQRRLLGGA